VNPHREPSGKLYGDPLLRAAVRAHFIVLACLSDKLYQARRAASAARVACIMELLDDELDRTLDRYYLSKQPS